MFYTLKIYDLNCSVFFDKTGFALANKESYVFFPFSSTYISESPNFFISKSHLNSYLVLLQSAYLGIHSGFFKVLHVKGIGFKSFYSFTKNALYFNLGYNHLTKYKLPSQMHVRLLKGYLILFSYNKQLLFQTLHEIQRLRYPDPYRGKGIRYRFQIIKFKPGKQR
jgi:ribosomal protein L6P/L9E